MAAEAALDGLYVIRTSVPVAQADSAEVVRHYQRLSHVEAAFRALKSDDLQIRPSYHHTEERVRVHLLLCMLAYYVKWHMADVRNTCRRKHAGAAEDTFAIDTTQGPQRIAALYSIKAIRL